MDINATLFGQAITFAILIWFVARFITPHLSAAIEERQKKIAEGLAAADKSMKDLAEAKTQVDGLIKDARAQAAEVLANANKRSSEMVDEAKEQARAEGERLVLAARAQIQQELGQAKEALRREVATLAVAGAKQILEREIDAKAHADLLDKVAKQLN
jgi:F-type H+-transporting ATPase subunit b